MIIFSLQNVVEDAVSINEKDNGALWVMFIAVSFLQELLFP